MTTAALTTTNLDPDALPAGWSIDELWPFVMATLADVFARCFASVLLEIEGDALIVTSPMRCAIETAMPLVRRAFAPPGRFVCHAELFEIGSNIYRDERPSELAARLEADFMLTLPRGPERRRLPRAARA